MLHLSSFAHCTNEKAISDYSKDCQNNIFLVIELSGMSYVDVVQMPVDAMQQYITWKLKFDKDKNEAQMKSLEKMKK